MNIKRCDHCHQNFPATNEFFHRHKSSHDGLKSTCKRCRLLQEERRRRGKGVISRSELAEKTRKDGMRRCSQCERWFPATLEYFRHRPDSSADNLKGICKKCSKANDEEKRRAKGVKPFPEIRKDGEKRCSRCHEWKPATTEFFFRSSRNVDGFIHYCKDCQNEVTKKWRDGVIQRARKVSREWNRRNPDKIRNAGKKHIALHPDSGRLNQHRRNARKMSLPDNFYERDWNYALDYFDKKCVVCGRSEDISSDIIIAADHWVALTDPRPDNPGTVPTNIVPLCHGKDGCNNKKSNHNVKEWLIEYFGEEKAAEVLARVDAYFKHLKEKERG